METGNKHQEMNTLSDCTATLLKRGYTENFQVRGNELYAPSKDKSYSVAEVSIDNFYRFEGDSDPADSSVLYALQTTDGTKGMLVSAYGVHANDADDAFIKQVKVIKKEDKKEH